MKSAAAGKATRTDAERVSYLFELYQQYTNLLPGDTQPGAQSTQKTPI